MLIDADILGVWRHSDYRYINQTETAGYTVTIELQKGGTFVQTIQMDNDGDTLEQMGEWQMVEDEIVLSSVLSEDFDSERDVAIWTAWKAYWWFVDCYDSNDGVALFGGLHPDPDSFNLWTKEAPVPESPEP